MDDPCSLDGRARALQHRTRVEGTRGLGHEPVRFDVEPFPEDPAVFAGEPARFDAEPSPGGAQGIDQRARAGRHRALAGGA
eukprot:3971479-Alexandrium_andersonii.AAC.1